MSMSSLIGIPTEISVAVLKLLGRQDMKQMRLVNRQYRRIATPLCFEVVIFDMSGSSIGNLVDISKDSLAEHPRTLVLKRRKRFRKFNDREDWEKAICLPGDPEFPHSSFMYDDQGDHTYEDVMAYNDWLQCADATREALYRRYEAARLTSNDSLQTLASQSRTYRLGCAYSEHVQPKKETLALQEFIVWKLIQALSKLTRLIAFQHSPTVLSNDRWVTEWERLLIEPCDFYTDSSYDKDCEEDSDTEALHLSCVLQAIGCARHSLPNFESIGFHVEGPAFWGPRRLRRLWLGEGHGKVRRLRNLFYHASEADENAETIPADYSRQDEYVRQLTYMETAIEGLTRLDCSVSEDGDNGGLFIAARSLFEFLYRGRNLRKVSLTFGWLVDGFIQSEYCTRAKGDGSQRLLTLLTDHNPWAKIVELKLEISTDESTLLRFLESLKLTLRLLTLSTVTFGPSQGLWDSALPAIATRLMLEQLNLANLCDHPHDRRARLLFTDEAACWASRKACYDEYTESVTRHLLLEKELIQLDPKAFLDNHVHFCKHVR